MRKKITKKQRRFIRKNYPELSIEEIAQRLKLEVKLVQQATKDLGLEVGSQSLFFNKIDRFFNRYAGIATSVITVGYILFFSFISIVRYDTFGYKDFDLAIFAQIAWNILHGSIQSSILDLPFLGSHLSFILFPIAGVYALFTCPLTLLLLQTILIGLGVIPVYFIARDNLGKAFAFVFSVLYLFYPALHFVNNYEFHPVALTIFFILAMIYFFEKERFFPFILFMFLSLLCKENISLGISFFGIYVLLFRKRSRKWWFLPLLCGAIWFICALSLLKYFNKGILEYNLIYGHLGETIPEIIGNLIQNPIIALKYVFSEANLQFLFQLFFPLAFLSLLSPQILFISIPFFSQQLLSARATDHTIYYHYTAKLIPFLFLSAIYGAKLMLKSRFLARQKWFILAVLLIVCIVSNIYFGFLPRVPAYFSSDYVKKDIDYAKQNLIDKVPKNASVVTTFEFLPKLSQRKEVYSFHHVCIGRHTLSSKEFVLPGDVEYALIDFNDYLTFTSFYRPDQYRNLRKFFAAHNWGLVAAADNIGLFKKDYKADIRLFGILEKADHLDSAKFLVDDDIIIQEYEIVNKKVMPGHASRLSLNWGCLKQTSRDYWIALKVVDRQGKVLHRYNHPVCYRVYPTYSWKKGDILKEDLWILIPSKVQPQDAWLKMVIFWRETAGARQGLAEIAVIKSNDSEIFDREGWINLGKIEILIGQRDVQMLQ